jgi:TonB family protein
MTSPHFKLSTNEDAYLQPFQIWKGKKRSISNSCFFRNTCQTATFETKNTKPMRKYILIALMLALSFFTCKGWAQVYPVDPPPPAPEDIIEEVDNVIFEFTEQPAEYDGGIDALNLFILQNQIYPKEAIELGLSGTVYVGFVIEKNATVSNVTIKRGIQGAPMLDKEALRIARLIKFKTPAYINGQPVRSSFILPLKFNLR